MIDDDLDILDDADRGDQDGGSDAGAGSWPPGAIADWLPSPAAHTLEHTLRTLGHTGAVSVLGVVAQQGPLSWPRVVELAQIDPPIVRARLRELSNIGLLIYHRRHGPATAMWELNHDAMIRIGAYFIRPRPTPPVASG